MLLIKNFISVKCFLFGQSKFLRRALIELGNSFCIYQSKEKLTKKFDKRYIKIPQYILEQYSKRSNVSKKHILEYLKKIDYNLGIKEKRSLKLFLKLTKEKGLK